MYVYSRLKERWGGKFLWLRANIANALAQTIDSVIFVSIAFWGMVPPANLTDIMVTGFTIKLAYIALTSVFLYLNHIESEDGGEFAQISIR